MSTRPTGQPVEILLVEDNPGDARLTREVLKESRLTNQLSLVEDGVEALEFLRQSGRYAHAKRPDLILLDLNLPRMDGREVLAEIKSDESLMVLTGLRDEAAALACLNQGPRTIW